MRNSWIVQTEDEGCRLNTFLKKKLGSSFTTKEIAWAIEHNGCVINGKLERFLSRKLRNGERLELSIQKIVKFELESSHILYEDDFLLAYNKPAKISSTDLAELVGYPPVHRLDRDTSGVILFAKKKEAEEGMLALFKQRRIKKTYLAITLGIPCEEKGVIEVNMGVISRREGAVIWGVVPKGLSSKTLWSVEKTGKECALLSLQPHTGRTHQLRVHLAHLGYPVLGDAVYGAKKVYLQADRQMLHAAKIEFKHPCKNQMMKFEAAYPEDFGAILESPSF